MLVLKRDKNGENNFSRHFRQLFEGKAAENNYASNCAWMKEKGKKWKKMCLDNVEKSTNLLSKNSFLNFFSVKKR